MADNGQDNPNSTSSVKSNLFVSGLIKDPNDTFAVEGSWSHARNASKVTAVGDLSCLSNEASTALCSLAPYPIIGLIHIVEDKWVVFSTDNAGGNPAVTHSEVGLFDDSQCTYYPIVQDPCPNFNQCPPNQTQISNTNDLAFDQFHLISGAAKYNFDCSWQLYWQDGNSPDRTLAFDIDDQGIPTPKPFYMQECCDTSGPCVICVPTCKVDSHKALLASLIDSPCAVVSKSRHGGSLPNGSYCVTLAYAINQQTVTDYFPISNVQPLFNHANLGGALEINFSGLDTAHFDEFVLVLVRNINQQTSCKRIGIYSTHTQSVSLDSVSEDLVTVPIAEIPIQTPVFEKSDMIADVGDYLVRTGPTSKFDFNYQPLANRINTKWVSTEYPSTYYRNGGNNPGYLRDEIYPFFIRWVYDTADRSSSYHIPGRVFNPFYDNKPIPAGDIITPGERYWEVVNTAYVIPGPVGNKTPDGGTIIQKGAMGYWESSEIYPDKNPLMWDLSAWSAVPGWNAVTGMGNPAYDLCGKPIRHHKMPDNLTDPTLAHVAQGGNTIRIVGVEFDNIHIPLDNLGNPIPGIVGYEILRGSREGNKTIIAKGMINNMRKYNTPQHAFPNPPDGLYQNYPYNDLGTDKTLSATQTVGGYQTLTQSIPLSQSRDDIFTFHSPDTQFKHPFLATNEFKLYGELTGVTRGAFSVSPQHPKEKLLNDYAFIISALVGVGEAMLAIRGQRTFKRPVIGSGYPTLDGYRGTTMPWAIAGPGSTGSSLPPGVAGFTISIPLEIASAAGATVYNTAITTLNTTLGQQGYGVANFTTLMFGGVDTYDIGVKTADTAAMAVPGLGISQGTTETQVSQFYANPFSAVTGIILFSHYWTLGTDTVLRLVKAIVPYRNYAYRFLSEGFYSNSVPGALGPGVRRYAMFDSMYLDDQRQSFNDKAAGAPYPNVNVNNLYRGEAVIFQTQKPVSVAHSVTDTSYVTIADAGYKTPTNDIYRDISSFYGALIQRIHNQYGQLDSIKQVPITCPFPINPAIVEQFTNTIFGGDTYVSRYTEKNTFFYFYDWLYGQPDGYQFDYKSRYMITFPTFWADFTEFEAGEFLSSILNPPFVTPSDKAALDRQAGSGFIAALIAAISSVVGLNFSIKDAFFYLFQSGVRDFFVESEVNTDLRDYGDLPEQRFYDPYSYTDIYSLFEPPIIKSGNYFKYDYSLSVSRMFQNFVSWGTIQARTYDPFVASSCYIHRPERLIYSLPQNAENKKDYWRVFLANNYKDFYSPVSAIKAYNANGAVILFQSDSPILWKGVDTLETDIGTKLTIGDGGLFAQPPQSIVNTDISLEYGSCQDSRSVLNTPFGLYYICVNQGKIFHITQNLDDITYDGLKFWFKEYLPFKLLIDFPSFELTNNPVAGIGCQSVYDNQIETIYFCKKDYKLINPLQPGDQYLGGRSFIISGVQFELGVPDTFVSPGVFTPAPWKQFFEDASFTISFDPKAQKGGWISYHDWHPDLVIPSKNNFLSTHYFIDPSTGLLQYGIHRHNSRRDDFCRYYEVQYPFEVEFVASTQLTVNTLRSIEYYLECYFYDPSGRLDRFHQLEQNFDHSIIYNTEQVSGMLKLTMQPHNNPWGRLAYPIISGTFIDILASKRENKFRFNQFWDITDNRGEFPPFAQRMIWITHPNGYVRDLNPVNLDYQKPEFQRKKFRQYLNKVWLQKSVSGASNFVVKAVIEKDLVSMR